MIKDLKEFDTEYNLDRNDLETLGVGSGVHLDKDVFIRFDIKDRRGEIISNNNDLASNEFYEAVVFDIADENGNIVYKNYQSGFSPSLIFTEKENQSVFGYYKKDFGVYATVIDKTTSVTPSGFISVYGNNLEISKVNASDFYGNKEYNESIGINLNATLEPSGYIYSGRMTPSDSDDLTEAVGYQISGEVLHEGSYYPWEAYLTKNINQGAVSGSHSYDQYSNVIQSGTFDYLWTLLILDYSPNNSFLMASGSSIQGMPYGDYIDPMGSGNISQSLYEIPINESGKNQGGGISMKIDYLNNPAFTKISHLDVYCQYGDELDFNKFEFNKTLYATSMRNINYNEDFALQNNKNLWLKFEPNSTFGKGEPWIVGPLKSIKREAQQEVSTSNVLSIGSLQAEADVSFKQRNINDILYNGSGVIDALLVLSGSYGPKQPIYESEESVEYEFETVPTDGNGRWLKTTFEYTLEFKNSNDVYSNATKKVYLTATGTSTNPPNSGLPLFLMKQEDITDTSDIDIQLFYNESGVGILCNVDNNYDSYKYYKTEF